LIKIFNEYPVVCAAVTFLAVVTSFFIHSGDYGEDHFAEGFLEAVSISFSCCIGVLVVLFFAFLDSGDNNFNELKDSGYMIFLFCLV